MADDETQVAEEVEEEVEEEAEEETEGKSKTDPNAGLITELREQNRKLMEMVNQREAAQTEKEAEKPKPLFSDEDMEEMEDGQKPFAKMLNVMGGKIDGLEKQLAGVEESTEDREFQQNVTNFVNSRKDLKADAKLQAKFREFITKALIEGDAKLFLEAAYSHLVGKKPPKKKKAMNSQESVTPGGTTKKSQTVAVSLEEAKERAREKQLKILRSK